MMYTNNIPVVRVETFWEDVFQWSQKGVIIYHNKSIRYQKCYYKPVNVRTKSLGNTAQPNEKFPKKGRFKMLFFFIRSFSSLPLTYSRISKKHQGRTKITNSLLYWKSLLWNTYVHSRWFLWSLEKTKNNVTFKNYSERESHKMITKNKPK